AYVVYLMPYGLSVFDSPNRTKTPVFINSPNNNFGDYFYVASDNQRDNSKINGKPALGCSSEPMITHGFESNVNKINWKIVEDCIFFAVEGWVLYDPITTTPTRSPTSTSTPVKTDNNSTPTRTPTKTPTRSLSPTKTPTISLSPKPVQLFDKASWSSVIPEPFKTYFDQSADRWNRYIKYNNEVRQTIMKFFPAWNGLALNRYSKFNRNTSTIASCGPEYFVDLNTSGRLNSVTFNVNINMYWEKYYSYNDWINIITHELGHALGIGIFWSEAFTSYGSTPPFNFFLNGTKYNGTQRAYNNICGLSRNLVPLEQSGGTGTASAHWENDFRSSSFTGGGRLSYPGVVDELMVGMV
ncbi:MAG: hypothetical protein ACK55Z_23135, partial [bacterium]